MVDGQARRESKKEFKTNQPKHQSSEVAGDRHTVLIFHSHFFKSDKEEKDKHKAEQSRAEEDRTGRAQSVSISSEFKWNFISIQGRYLGNIPRRIDQKYLQEV